MAAEIPTRKRGRMFVASILAALFATIVVSRRRQLAKNREEFHARYG